MKKLLLILFIIIVGVLIFIKTVNINKYKPLAEVAIYDASGYKTKIKGKISVSLIPFGVKISDISIKNPSSFYKKVATVGTVYIGISPISLIFGGNVKVRNITIKNLDIHIVQNKNGTLNTYIATKTKKSSKNSSKGFSINKITIKNASLYYENQKDKQYILVKNINLATSLNYEPGNKTYKGITASGSLHIEKITVNRISPITDLKAAFSMNEGVLNIKKLTYKLFNSDTSGNMSIDFSQGGLCEIRQTSKRLNLVVLSAALYKNLSLEGFVYVNADLYFDMGDAAETLNGIFVANGKNIVLKGENLDKIIEGYEKTNSVNAIDIGSFFIVGPLGILADKAYSIGSVAEGLNGKTHIRRLVAKIKIENGKGYLMDVAFSTDKNRIAAKGVLDFISKRYENVKVAVLDKNGCAKIIQQIEGSFSNPKVKMGRTVIGTLVNKAKIFFKKLEKSIGIKSRKCTPFYKGIVQQP